eukprot:5826719-Lingulodinium_polyedra.AAC.1
MPNDTPYARLSQYSAPRPSHLPTRAGSPLPARARRVDGPTPCGKPLARLARARTCHGDRG